MGSSSRSVAIIGAGFAGLGLAIELRRAGITNFTLFERAASLGGTWRDNTYPGAGCDTPAFSYCYSFAQKTDWTRKWALQPEILGYLERCAHAFDLVRHIRFGSPVEEARFDESTGQWRVRTPRGEETFDFLVSAVGQLNRPSQPELPGTFAGVSFHSARWRHDVPLTDKRVAVIGNAASAVQLVPEVARQAQRLYVFQRTPNWVVPKGDYFYAPRWQRRLEKHRWLARAYRWWFWLQHEVRWSFFLRNAWLMPMLGRRLARRHLARQIADPALRERLTPRYRMGAKRILISDDYYPALTQPHVELVTDPIARLEPDGIITGDGAKRVVDVVIYATGFEASSFLVPMHIEGLGGRVLSEVWSPVPKAYLGISAPGFPNFFVMYGPNTNLGHNSIIFMLECQSRYIRQCIARTMSTEAAWIDVNAAFMEREHARQQRRLDATVWAQRVGSWYKNAQGVITNNWAGSTAAYWWHSRRPPWRYYHLQKAPVMREAPAAARAS